MSPGAVQKAVRMTASPHGNLHALLEVLEARRPVVAAHSRRVASYAVRLAAAMGLSRQLTDVIRVGALVHDAGSLFLPTRLVPAGRPEPAAVGERTWRTLQVARQCGVGDAVADLVRQWHQRYDGGCDAGAVLGPPALPARIVAVMHRFDELTSAREHRRRMGPEAARFAIAREAGRRFCPWVVNALRSLPVSMLRPGDIDASEWGPGDGAPVDPRRLASFTAWPGLPSWGDDVLGPGSDYRRVSTS
jgi:response regulator RpfG family c-di-GMP phosphodiesterase